jgi:hypothetical protein
MSGSGLDRHPDAQRLDALAAGDDDAEASAHVAGCAACAEYVAGLRQAAAEFAQVAPPGPKVVPLGRYPLRAAVALIPMLAAAAAFLLLVRGTPPLPSESDEAQPNMAETRFKGIGQLAVVREREGRQERFTGSVQTRPYDRLRVEIGVGSTATLMVGLLEDDGNFALLLRPRELDPGTHHSEKAALLDARPTTGWILAGAPEAIERARKSRDFRELSLIRVEPEP